MDGRDASRSRPARAGGGSGGYANGGGYGGYGGYDRSVQNGYGEEDGRREQDRGGYGGYGGYSGGGASSGGYSAYNADAGRDDYSRDLQPPRRSQERSRSDRNGYGSDMRRERSRERGDPRNDPRSRSNTRMNGGRGYGPGTKKLDDILRIVEKDWDFMTLDSCIPVKVALSLMDTSSLGRAHRLDDFMVTHRDLQYALQAIVNDHHQGFNSSIGTFHSIMRSITTSQSKVRELRESLIKAKADLSVSKPEVKHMVENSQKYDAMLRTLSSIEQLQLVPENLDARISEKRFLTAVEILSDALKLISRPDLKDIGALSDLRTYLGSQESSLADILVEELHNHLYLKSLYCADRWKPYSASQKDTPNLVDVAAEDDSESGKRALHRFLDSNDFSHPMVEDVNTTKNPEADSLYYIRLILEALHNLGHLSNAVASVNQRLPVELFKLVDKTNNEVDQRHPSSISLSTMSRGGLAGKTLDLGLGENDVRVTVIHDLLWTLYSKFEAVMEGHRVIYDVLKGIGKRDGCEEVAFLATGFLEVWQLIQSEMRSLLHDYLTMNDNRTLYSAAPKHNAVNNIVTGKLPRDKNKVLFQLSHTDTTSSTMKIDQEDLEHILKSSVPGLVSESLRPAVSAQDNNNSHDGSATGHKLLIEPSVFNIGLLLPPSLAFLKRVKEIVPTGSGIVLSTLPSFLDDFLVNVFHPSLEDTLRDLFNQTTGDLDAFHQDSEWPAVAKKPLMKGTTAFFGLITAFCKMLDTIPPDQALGQLTIDLLTSYYDKCYDWYKDLVHDSDAGTDLKKSARWARDSTLREVMGGLWMESAPAEELLKKETDAELADKGSRLLLASELISSRKVINSLCLLCNSMKWLASKVVHLRHVEDPESVSGKSNGNSGRLRRRWTLIESARALEEKPIYLPMTTETVGAFDEIIKSYRELATTVLYTLHAEARCHVIHHLERCLTEGNYCLESPIQTPDPNVLALNSELVWYDEEVSTMLPERETGFIIHGLGALMDHILVSRASSIKILNMTGVERMKLNILVLQQTLKNIEKSAALERSRTFYTLHSDGMENVLAQAKDGKLDFSYEELKVIMELFFSEAMNNRRESASAVQARRSLNEHLLTLSEIMWFSIDSKGGT